MCIGDCGSAWKTRILFIFFVKLILLLNGICWFFVCILFLSIVLLLYVSTKWSVRFLCDCDSEDKYFYIISVHTGLRPGAGTDSNVNFVLAGEAGDTGVRCLSDGIEHVSLSISNNHFGIFEM